MYSSSLRFLFRFLLLFTCLYAFHLLFIGACHPGGIYIAGLARNLDYIGGWRVLLLQSSAAEIRLLGYHPHIYHNQLYAEGRGGILLSYSCIGYGTSSFFSAFVLSWPAGTVRRLQFLLPGLFLLQVLNTLRLTLIVVYWKGSGISKVVNHHLLFNTLIDMILLAALHYWTRKRKSEAVPATH